MSYLELQGISKRYGEVQAVTGVDLSVERGELVTLLGPSGCGKTTLLRITAGLEGPDTGVVRLEGEDITGLPPYARRMGMVFQAPTLFPNLRVRDNIGFGLRIAGQDGATVAERVGALMDLAGLTGRAEHFPHQLSGGEQQRAALARALAVEPRVLLMDEPLTALDAPLRASLRTEIHRIQQRLRVTAIYVTHDQEEALGLSDRVVVMNRGRIEEVGRPQELYRSPRTPFTATFIGSSTIVQGVVEDGGEGEVAVGSVRLRSTEARRLPAGERVRLLIRAEAVRLVPPGACAPPGSNVMAGMLSVKSFRGPVTLLEVDVEGILVKVEAASEIADSIGAGMPLELAVAPEACRVVEVLPAGEPR